MNHLFPWNPVGSKGLFHSVGAALVSAALNSVNLAMYAATLIVVWRVLA